MPRQIAFSNQALGGAVGATRAARRSSGPRRTAAISGRVIGAEATVRSRIGATPSPSASTVPGTFRINSTTVSACRSRWFWPALSALRTFHSPCPARRSSSSARPGDSWGALSRFALPRSTASWRSGWLRAAHWHRHLGSTPFSSPAGSSPSGPGWRASPSVRSATLDRQRTRAARTEGERRLNCRGRGAAWSRHQCGHSPIANPAPAKRRTRSVGPQSTDRTQE